MVKLKCNLKQKKNFIKMQKKGNLLIYDIGKFKIKGFILNKYTSKKNFFILKIFAFEEENTRKFQYFRKFGIYKNNLKYMNLIK